MTYIELDQILLDLSRRLEKEKSLRRRILLESAMTNLKEFDRLTREN
ncbi:MAG: hypothetical protein J4215_01500 [Candidatus Diapherotrites archaeon]|uniref:Uncharacterized protein n=1 Tax=Candidatus Iainarchaeum sp. TaxID=3101447 RepID=A0A8T4L900_9ARCH|nr:hypothetical protein [Candidatus Diapherotrites archaeon]